MSETNAQPAPQPEAPAQTTETSSTDQVPEQTTEVSESEELLVDANFSELADFVDGVEPESASEEAPKTEVEVIAESETPKEETPTETPVSEEPTPEAASEEETPAPAEAETATPESESEPEPAPEPVKLPTKEELEGLYEDFRKESLPLLEQQYVMDDETAQAFDDNPREVLPKIAAQLHYNAMMSSYNAMCAALPSIVGQVIEASKTADTAANQFYEAWPELKAHEKVVRVAIRSYRQANPTAKLEQVIEKAGTLAMINAGLDPKRTPEPEPTPVVAPPKPVAPAGGSPTPPATSKPKSDNMFGDLSESFDEAMTNYS